MTRRTRSVPSIAPSAHITRYRDRIFDAKRHDPYQPNGKHAESIRCSQCGAVYEHGRWRWGVAPPQSHSGLCPACHRIADKLPAGVLTLDGPYVAAHQDELARIARNEAEREAPEHPMHRIMQIDVRDGRIEISTTDIHLPQRIGAALKHAHHGDLRVQYGSDEYTVRAHWHR